MEPGGLPHHGPLVPRGAGVRGLALVAEVKGGQSNVGWSPLPR